MLCNTSPELSDFSVMLPLQWAKWWVQSPISWVVIVGPNNAGKSPSSLSEGKSWYEANSKKIQRMKPWWGQITVSIAKLVETCKFALAQGEGHCTLRTQILSIIQGLLSLNICYCYRSDSMSPSKYNRRTNLAKVLQAKAFLECLF